MLPNVDIALGQLETFNRRIANLDEPEWKTPTALPDWDVTELVRHVTAVAWMQAEAFHRARLGIAEAPSWATVTAGPADLPALLGDAYAHLAVALERAGLDRDPTVPLPYATLPASLALGVLVLEYAVHLYDLRAAVDPDASLDGDATAVVMQLLPLWMPLVGTPADNGTSIALGDIALGYEDGWQFTDRAACTVSGEPGALALFALGRIDADHRSLTVTGDEAIARRFKTLFPGP